MKYFVKMKKDIVFYYDTEKDQICTIPLEELKEKQQNSYAKRFYQIQGLHLYDTFHCEYKRDFACYLAKELRYPYPYNQINMHFFTYACNTCHQGENLLDFINYYKEAPEIYKKRQIENQQREEMKLPQKEGAFLSYITSNKGVKIEREMGNRNTKTFDFIRVSYGVSSSIPREELLSCIKQDYKRIAHHALQQITQSKRFLNYGIPINFLKVAGCALTRDSLLQFTFELKEKALELREELEEETELERE